MNNKKILSAALSLALCASGASGFGVQTAQARVSASIGTVSAGETFDDYNGAGWSQTLQSSLSGAGIGLCGITEIAAPAVGSAAADGSKPTYVSGSALAVRAAGSSGNTAEYTSDTAFTSGTVYFGTDIFFRTNYAHDGSRIAFNSSSGDEVLSISIPQNRNTLSVTGTTSASLSGTLQARSYNGARIDVSANLDEGYADVTVDYINTKNSNIRTIQTLTVDIEAGLDIASFSVTSSSYNRKGSQYSDTIIDNTQFYNESGIDADILTVSYVNSAGAAIYSYSTDLSGEGLTAGDAYSYYAPAYIEGSDGMLYKTTGKDYSRSANLSAGTTYVVEDVVLEAEAGFQYAEFDGDDPYAGRYHLASNGSVKGVGSSSVLLTVAEDGVYNIKIATASVGKDGTYRKCSLYTESRTLTDTLSYGSKPGEYTLSNKRLYAGETITMTGRASQTAVDYIVIERTDDIRLKKMEALDRGIIAVNTGSGVYLSWRLFGTESLESQAFDIYRDGAKIYTTGEHDATNYTDAAGTSTSKYIVVPAGEGISGETSVSPIGNYTNYKPSGSSYVRNRTAYFDIPIDPPADEVPAPAADGTSSTTAASYSANDASVGDLDGDGEYEIVLKWYPDNAKDNSASGLTSNVYIDAYKLDGTKLWRINLGKNIRAGAHYTQFIVYDLDGDGKAEVAMQTAPGSVDGKGKYVSAAGDTSAIVKADNSANYRNSGGRILEGPEYLTVFNGETGAALCTTDFIARGNVSDWGDSYGNRCDRMLAGVAYLDAYSPSLIMTRGYYAKSVAAAYDWDGSAITRRWINESTSKTSSTVTYADGTTVTSSGSIYGQGNHSLEVCDADNDGKDEIVFGSAVIDDDGTVLNSTGHGHGDAHHISDFNNDGLQEIFQVHEDSSVGAQGYSAELRRASDGAVLVGQTSSSDNGRGVMDNFMDDSSMSQFWSSSIDGTYSAAGSALSASRPNGTGFINSMMYWDEDLGRELLDGNKLGKLVSEDGVPAMKRFIWASSKSYFPGGGANNSSKGNACLTADILGDWREEAIFRGDSNNLRVFVSAAPTDYRLFTLMHDSQYREGVAIENVGYNQPPHTSYYIGSDALAKDSSGNALNYLAPAAGFNEITTD